MDTQTSELIDESKIRETEYALINYESAVIDLRFYLTKGMLISGAWIAFFVWCYSQKSGFATISHTLVTSIIFITIIPFLMLCFAYTTYRAKKIYAMNLKRLGIELPSKS